MFRLSNLADYALVLLSHVAADHGAAGSAPKSARDLASASGLPAPTVAKVLKSLVRAALLCSRRGAQGGYVLARPPAGISIADVVAVFDGPVALTRCTAHHVDAATGAREPCNLMSRCPVRAAWAPVNQTVSAALSKLTLQDMFSAASSPARSVAALPK